MGVWQGRSQVLGSINNFIRAKGGHRLGMSSWGLLRCHCQWMALLPRIFTTTELECSDNQPRHLRYGSRWANTCLECSSLSHWKGHLPLLSGRRLRSPTAAGQHLLGVYQWVFLRSLYSWSYFEWIFTRQPKPLLLLKCTEYWALAATQEGTAAPWRNSCKNVLKMPNPATFSLSLVQQNNTIWNFFTLRHTSFPDFSFQNEISAQLVTSEISEDKYWTPVATLSLNLKTCPVSFLVSSSRPTIFLSVTLQQAHNTKSI